MIPQLLRSREFILVANGANRGYAAAANQGLRFSSSEFVVFLNPDANVIGECLERMLGPFDDASVSAVGPLCSYVCGLQFVGPYLPPHSSFGSMDAISEFLQNSNPNSSIETNLFIGFCVAYRKSHIDSIGGFDEEKFAGNDDLDLSWRLRLNGGCLLVATDAFVWHEGGVRCSSVGSAKKEEMLSQCKSIGNFGTIVDRMIQLLKKLG